MTDYFALLGQVRQPWLDPKEVQTRFLALSEGVHPDRVHEASSESKSAAHERFAALNAAWQCLRDPKDRLRHLLELEHGVTLTHLERLPAEAADFYFKVGQVCRQADGLLAEKTLATAPLVKVQLFSRGLQLIDRLDELQATLEERRARLQEQLEALNPAWTAAPAVGAPERASRLPLDLAERIYRELSYVNRWSNQIRERRLQLSF